MSRQYLTREEHPTRRVDLQFEPTVCFVASGAKRTEVGPHSSRVERGEMFLSLVDAPVSASFEAPYRSATLRIDFDTVAALLAEGAVIRHDPTSVGHGFAVAPIDDRLADAVTRWVGLLDEPEHVILLAPRLEQEILYRVLVGPLGPVLRSGVAAGPVAEIRSAAAFLIAHADEVVSIADLARRVAMSPATLHRHFKRVTGMSPMQFQKTARLQRARRLLLSGRHTAASAASAVGYLSPTQFSRDYRRHYGAPPVRDAAHIRATDQ